MLHLLPHPCTPLAFVDKSIYHEQHRRGTSSGASSRSSEAPSRNQISEIPRGYAQILFRNTLIPIMGGHRTAQNKRWITPYAPEC